MCVVCVGLERLAGEDGKPKAPIMILGGASNRIGEDGNDGL